MLSVDRLYNNLTIHFNEKQVRYVSYARSFKHCNEVCRYSVQQNIIIIDVDTYSLLGRISQECMNTKR